MLGVHVDASRVVSFRREVGSRRDWASTSFGVRANRQVAFVDEKKASS
jgi:hypothetical protein